MVINNLQLHGDLNDDSLDVVKSVQSETTVYMVHSYFIEGFVLMAND